MKFYQLAWALCIAFTLSVREVGVSKVCMNALPCAGWVLWDTAVLREFCLQPSLPMRWAFQAYNRDKVAQWVRSSPRFVSRSGQPRVTVGLVKARMAALPLTNTAVFHWVYAHSSGSESVTFCTFFFSFIFKGVRGGRLHVVNQILNEYTNELQLRLNK